jgi:hypothetical protein
MDISIRSGGLRYDATWVRCLVQASFKPDEAIVAVAAEDVAEPLAFFVDNALVRPADPPRDHKVDGAVKAILLGRENGSALIEVLGEPLSFGPRFTVSSDLLSENASQPA